MRQEKVRRPQNAAPLVAQLEARVRGDLGATAAGGARLCRVRAREALDALGRRDTEAQLVGYRAELRCPDVVRRVHGRMRGSHDGREVRAVARVDDWVPGGVRQRRLVARRRGSAQHHRVGPLPRVKHAEEAANDRRARGARVALADEGDEDGAVDAAEHAENVGVEALFSRPLLYGAERDAERDRVGDESEQHLGHPRAVQRPDGRLVEAREQRVVEDVEGALRQRFAAERD
mmetsp:Transcript_12975/g.44897  ORF Transcript_12975/g.44897 Transcript_12975/m.44897 type:complete len:233 (+) Transcript_12975:433-1131(+)